MWSTAALALGLAASLQAVAFAWGQLDYLIWDECHYLNMASFPDSAFGEHFLNAKWLHVAFVRLCLHALGAGMGAYWALKAICFAGSLIFLVCVFLLAMEWGLSRAEALLAAGLAAGAPVFLSLALRPMSETVALAPFGLGLLSFALSARRGSRGAGVSPASAHVESADGRRDACATWAVASGAWFGLAYCIRSAQAVPILAFLGAAALCGRGWKGASISAASGFVIGVAAWLGFHRPDPPFALTQSLLTEWKVSPIHAIAGFVPALGLLLPLALFGALAAKRQKRRRVAQLAVWALAAMAPTLLLIAKRDLALPRFVLDSTIPLALLAAMGLAAREPSETPSRRGERVFAAVAAFAALGFLWVEWEIMRHDSFSRVAHKPPLDILLMTLGTAGAAALFIAPRRRRWGAGMAAALSLLFGMIHVVAQLPYGGDEFSTVAPRQIARLLNRAEAEAGQTPGAPMKRIGYYDHADFEATLNFLFPDWTFVNSLDDPRARRLWPDRVRPASAPNGAGEPRFWLLSKFRSDAEPSDALNQRLARSRIVEETQGFWLLQEK